MSELVSTISAEEDLDALLAGLGLSEDETKTAPVEPVEEILGETDLEAAVMSAEAQEAVSAHYDEEVVEDAVAPAEADPMQDPSVLFAETEAKEAAHALEVEVGIAAAPVEPEAPKKEKKAKKEKPEGEKKDAPKRKHYASKEERITDKFGAELGEYLILEVKDAALEGDALKEAQENTLASMNAVGTKVQNRVTYLIEFAGGKSAKLNDIAVAAMKLLKSDGKITTGEKGNLFAELSKTHAKSSANAMGNNTIGAMRVLKMVVSNEKGEYVPNPQSLYFLKISGMLGL